MKTFRPRSCLPTAFLVLVVVASTTLLAWPWAAQAQEGAAQDGPAQDGTAQDGTAKAETSLPPEWFVKHLQTMTENNGRWIANNAAHRSDTEPFDAYGMAWRWGIGKKSATSRLFVVKGGEDLGTLWESRTVWHPGNRKALTYSFGSDGSYGVGTLEPVNDHEIKVEEEFFEPDGSTYRTGHRVMDLGKGQMKMQSFGISPDGKWTPRRTYVWQLEGISKQEGRESSEEKGPDEGANEKAGEEPAAEEPAAENGAADAEPELP